MNNNIPYLNNNDIINDPLNRSIVNLVDINSTNDTLKFVRLPYDSNIAYSTKLLLKLLRYVNYNVILFFMSNINQFIIHLQGIRSSLFFVISL